MKIRTIALTASALAIPAGVIGGGIASADTATSKVFTGSISGVESGSIKITPPLTNTASTGPVTFKITATLSNITGNKTEGGVTITGGTYSSTASSPKGTTCGTLASGKVPTGAGTATYTATGGTAAPSKTTFGSSKLTSTSPITITLSQGKTTGSFATASASKAKLIIDQTLSAALAKCGAGGLSSLTFTGKNGKSTFTNG